MKNNLGRNGPSSSLVGLGCMGMSDFYGPADRQECIATVKLALESGVTLLDTGDFYGMGHNELLLAEALEGCLLYTSPSPRDRTRTRMPSSA